MANRKKHLWARRFRFALLAVAGGLSGCAGSSFYRMAATEHYSVEAAGAERAVPQSRSRPVFDTGESSVGFISAYSRNVYYYGLPLNWKASAAVRPVTPGRSYSFMFWVDPGPRSLVIVGLDAFRIRLDGVQTLLEPTHYEIERGSGSCAYLEEARQLRAYGAGCYVSVFFTGAEHPLGRHTLTPAPVESDEVLYHLPDIVFE